MGSTSPYLLEVFSHIYQQTTQNYGYHPICYTTMVSVFNYTTKSPLWYGKVPQQLQVVVLFGYIYMI